MQTERHRGVQCRPLVRPLATWESSLASSGRLVVRCKVPPKLGCYRMQASLVKFVEAPRKLNKFGVIRIGPEENLTNRTVNAKSYLHQLCGLSTHPLTLLHVRLCLIGFDVDFISGLEGVCEQAMYDAVPAATEPQ